ncbi:MAG TPA: glycogen synthase GlgA [Rudaea sp.]|nr:glycogen synthase GlgA [Rudaea sp.]
MAGSAGQFAPVRVLQVASEIFPLVKTGGLADVCGALPKALYRHGVDVRLLMPAYPSALDIVAGLHFVADLEDAIGEPNARLLGGSLPDTDVPLWLLDCPRLFQRSGTPYQTPGGDDWPDNAQRYGMLCRAATQLALGRTAVRWRPDIVHCHDWHTGLVPLMLRLAGEPRPRTVFTVHNAAFQGNFPAETAALLGLPAEVMTSSGAEFYGQLSFLKSGVVFADKITTVSPTYARELRTREFGCGLEGVFDSRASDLTGILNGIDNDVWNPATDPFLAQRYSRNDPAGKQACKRELQQRLRLHEDNSAPIAMFSGRLTEQKMADVLAERMPAIMQKYPSLQFALLGQGERQLERKFVEFASGFRGRAAVEIGYEESVAHRLHGGSDLLLHGSRFEPCGLTQLYAMRYGTVPIVSRVGGLADSVADLESQAEPATGFVFDDTTGDALEAAIDRGLAVFANQPQTWQGLRHRAMAADFGWERSALEYCDLYTQLAAPDCADAADTESAPLHAAA